MKKGSSKRGKAIGNLLKTFACALLNKFFLLVTIKGNYEPHIELSMTCVHACSKVQFQISTVQKNIVGSLLDLIWAHGHDCNFQCLAFVLN